MSSPLPEMHKVLHFTGVDQPLTVETRPTPRAELGSLIIRVLAAAVQPYSGAIYKGTGPLPPDMLSQNFVPGGNAVGRVVETGSDSTTLTQGQLVLFDATVRGRDNPNAIYLSGTMAGFDDASRKLSAHRADSKLGQFAKVPLENCLAIGEPIIRELGYEIHDLAHLFPMLVGFGGLSDIGLQPGETVVVAPATGKHGGAAVHVALAMGARVIAMGRNRDTLERLVRLDFKRVMAVCMTDDMEADRQSLISASKGRPIHAYLDISPSKAAGSTHLNSCIKAVSQGGRVSLMGGIGDDAVIPYGAITYQALTLRGTWNCTPEQARRPLAMVHAGILWAGKFRLGEWREAFDIAAKHNVSGKGVIIIP
ncbi:hypothetical protein QQX98_006969 [Neonectria punicea]|uniref:Alcohol dehydrogenase-like C-terminal domain-containing protein n=1 Tax=Neonectria punicea TaxID=979145 RepID=A0ABR1GZS1_9HYPO